MTAFPPELAALAALLDAQPGPVQQAFQYCLAMLLVEGGKARLVATIPSEAGLLCTFETVAGDVFTLPRPPMSEEDEEMMMQTIREILVEEGIWPAADDLPC